MVHRKPERRLLLVASDIERLQKLEQAGAFVPRRLVGPFGHVVALECRHRHEGLVSTREFRGERFEIRLDPIVNGLIPVDDVHLVDGHDDLGNAQERGDHAVPSGLHAHAVSGIDQ